VLFGTARARVLGAIDDSAVRVIVPACLPTGEVAVTALLAGATTNAVPVKVAERRAEFERWARQPLEPSRAPPASPTACVRLRWRRGALTWV
jgi:hypothetical protein